MVEAVDYSRWEQGVSRRYQGQEYMNLTCMMVASLLRSGCRSAVGWYQISVVIRADKK